MKTVPKKPITWQQLKDYANSLGEEYLSEKVAVCGEDRGFNIQAAEGLGYEGYQSDEGIEPIEMFEPFDEDDKLEDKKRYSPDYPLLFIDLYEEEKDTIR